MIACPGEDGFAQGDGFEVVPAADFRFLAFLDGDQKLSHRADERVREPHFRPARLKPIARPLLCREIECAGDLGGVARPADRARSAGVRVFPFRRRCPDRKVGAPSSV